MDFGLKGKTVVIVGGSSNLGRACAINIAMEGANVVIASRTQANIDRVVSYIKGLNVEGEVSGFSFNAENHEDCKKLADMVVKKHGRIDSLVMSLGFAQHAEFLDIPPGNWRKTIDSNYTSVLGCVYAILPIMIEQKSGNMVVMGSVLGRLGSVYESVYSGLKAAVQSFFHSLVLGYSKYGLRFNIVAPATTVGNKNECGDDSLWVKAFSPKDIEELVTDTVAVTPMGTLATADDVGKACLFFVSDVMSGHVTGNVIGTDGGMYMGK